MIDGFLLHDDGFLNDVADRNNACKLFAFKNRQIANIGLAH